MTDAVATINHTVIRHWVESRNGRPARAAAGVLHIDFGHGELRVQRIEWDEFFTIFEDRRLAFIHKDLHIDGRTSHFNRFVERQ